MKLSIICIFIFLNFCTANVFGQQLIRNMCDSTVLTKQDFEKCKLDDIYTEDVFALTNYLIEFKTNLLPRYRLIRMNLELSPELKRSLMQLRNIYDTVLNSKISSFKSNMDINQKYVQPKAYISSLLKFEIFNFYPDVNAILLNDIHLKLQSQTSVEDQKKYKAFADQILKFIPIELYTKIKEISTAFELENSKLINQKITKLFQGLIQEETRKQYEVLNFLLWID